MAILLISRWHRLHFYLPMRRRGLWLALFEEALKRLLLIYVYWFFVLFYDLQDILDLLLDCPAIPAFGAILHEVIIERTFIAKPAK